MNALGHPSVVLGTMAVALLALGAWGYRNAADKVPTGLREEERVRRTGVMRRGGLACLVLGLAFATVAIALIVVG